MQWINTLYQLILLSSCLIWLWVSIVRSLIFTIVNVNKFNFIIIKWLYNITLFPNYCVKVERFLFSFGCQKRKINYFSLIKVDTLSHRLWFSVQKNLFLPSFLFFSSQFLGLEEAVPKTTFTHVFTHLTTLCLFIWNKYGWFSAPIWYKTLNRWRLHWCRVRLDDGAIFLAHWSAPCHSHPTCNRIVFLPTTL